MMKNKEIIERINALGSFTKEKIPTKLSFAVVKNFNKLKLAYNDYDESRKVLLDEYSEKNEKGEVVKDENGIEKIEAKYLDAWMKEITELLNIDVDVEIHTIVYADIENTQLSVSDMAAIEFMIKE